MLPRAATACRAAARARTRPAGTSQSASSSTATPPPPTRRPPTERPPFFTAAAIYPFILVSILSSTALNLSYQRIAREREGARLRAQVSVLESLLARLRTAEGRTLSEAEQEEIERELELVGLGRGAGKEAVDAESSVKVQTTWSEMLFGKKGKEYEEKEDETDWDAGAPCYVSLRKRQKMLILPFAVLREVDAAESARQAAPAATSSSMTATLPARSTPSPSSAPVTSAPSPEYRPPPRSVYL